jgi:hypothetical protein
MGDEQNTVHCHTISSGDYDSGLSILLTWNKIGKIVVKAVPNPVKQANHSGKQININFLKLVFESL